jgi:hypothetical protein
MVEVCEECGKEISEDEWNKNHGYCKDCRELKEWFRKHEKGMLLGKKKAIEDFDRRFKKLKE